MARAPRPWKTQRLTYRPAHTGWYEVQLRIAGDGGGRYTLCLSKGG